MPKFNFGENLRNIRIVKGISQDVMAQKFAISQRSYGRLEKKSEVPVYDLVCRIAKILDIEPEKLLPPWDEFDPLYVRSVKVEKEGKPKPFLNTSLGNIIIIGSSIAILGAVFEFTWGVCDALGMQPRNAAFIRWAVTGAVFLFIFYSVKRIKRKIDLR